MRRRNEWEQANLTICYRKKQIDVCFHAILSCYWRWISAMNFGEIHDQLEDKRMKNLGKFVK